MFDKATRDFDIRLVRNRGDDVLQNGKNTFNFCIS